MHPREHPEQPTFVLKKLQTVQEWRKLVNISVNLTCSWDLNPIKWEIPHDGRASELYSTLVGVEESLLALTILSEGSTQCQLSKCPKQIQERTLKGLVNWAPHFAPCSQLHPVDYFRYQSVTSSKV